MLLTLPLATGLISEQATWTSPRSVRTSSSPELGLQMHTMCQTFFLKKKYRLWDLNLDPHACKARQALYWVITPVPENQNVINISSACFVSPRSCTDGEVLNSSLKKKKKSPGMQKQKITQGHPWSRLVLFCLYLASFKKYFASNNQGKRCSRALTRLQQGQHAGRTQDFHLKTGRSYWKGLM